MKVYFTSEKLKKICEDQRKLIKEFGAENGKRIAMRLNEFYSVDNLACISTDPPPRRHQLLGDRNGQFAVDIRHPFRIVFEPANNPLPVDPSGNLDITRVTEIKITEVVDYHGR